MKNDKTWELMFGLFLISIPLMFLGNILVIGLVYLLICILDIVEKYRNGIERDLRGYIVLILSFGLSILFCLIGIANIYLS